MTAQEWSGHDRDGWLPHVVIVVFGVLVAAILAAVPGWAAPLHVWAATAALVFVALAADAACRALASTGRRRWRAALPAWLLVAGLAGAATAMLQLPVGMAGHDDAFGDASAAVVRAPASPDAHLP